MVTRVHYTDTGYARPTTLRHFIKNFRNSHETVKICQDMKTRRNLLRLRNSLLTEVKVHWYSDDVLVV